MRRLQSGARAMNKHASARRAGPETRASLARARSAVDPYGTMVVSAAASKFMRAIRETEAFLATLEREGFHPSDLGGARFYPPPPDQWFIPGVDAKGRALILRRRKDGLIGWAFHRRTRRLAGETGPARRAFVLAVKTHPGSAPQAVRKAREAFARAMRDARARDTAMKGRDHG